MQSRAIVSRWSELDGWGVVDSGATPGGCWVHFSSIHPSSSAHLIPGEAVIVEWEEAKQDGYSYRAVRLWRAWVPDSPAALEPLTEMSAAHQSRLTLTFPDSVPSTKVVTWADGRVFRCQISLTGDREWVADEQNLTF